MCVCLTNRTRATSEPYVSDGAYFDGTGYAKFNFSQSGKGYSVQQEIKLLSQNGILLMMQNEVTLLIRSQTLRGLLTCPCKPRPYYNERRC